MIDGGHEGLEGGDGLLRADGGACRLRKEGGLETDGGGAKVGLAVHVELEAFGVEVGSVGIVVVLVGGVRELPDEVNEEGKRGEEGHRQGPEADERGKAGRSAKGAGLGRTKGDERAEMSVLVEPSAKATEGRAEKREEAVGAESGGLAGELSEVVPGSVGDPSEFGLCAQGPDVGRGVRRAECADGAHVGEEEVVRGAGDESLCVCGVDIDGGREENGVGDVEDAARLWEGNGAAVDGEDVEGAGGGFKADGEVEMGRLDGVEAEPVGGDQWLRVGAVCVSLEVVSEGTVALGIAVKEGVEALVKVVAFRWDDKCGDERVEVGALREEVKDLVRRVEHDRKVHVGDGGRYLEGLGLVVTGEVATGEDLADAGSEVDASVGEAVHFLGLHEECGGGELAGESGELGVVEVVFDGLVGGMRVSESPETGEGKAVLGEEEVGEFLREEIRVVGVLLGEGGQGVAEDGLDEVVDVGSACGEVAKDSERHVWSGGLVN